MSRRLLMRTPQRSGCRTSKGTTGKEHLDSQMNLRSLGVCAWPINQLHSQSGSINYRTVGRMTIYEQSVPMFGTRILTEFGTIGHPYSTIQRFRAVSV